MVKHPHSFHVLTGATISSLIDSHLSTCLSVIYDAYRMYDSGNAVAPPSTFLRFPKKPSARIIALPAHLATDSPIAGIKWISSYPDNVERGYARASAVIILNSDDDGYPVACLEGSAISAARTAASAVIVAESVRPHKTARAVGFVGAGFIGRSVYKFLLGTSWSLNSVFIYDIHEDRARIFAQEINERSPSAHAVHTTDINQLLASCDMIIFATVASSPHVHEASAFAHNPLVLHLSLRDLAPSVILSAYNVTDDVDHVHQAGTSLHLTEQQTGNRNHATLSVGDLLFRRCPVDSLRPLIFSPFGLGVLDLALAQWVFLNAQALGSTLKVDEFF